MPTVNVDPAYFFKLFGETLDWETLEQTCFDFGIELEKGVVEEDGVKKEIYKFEVAANRYDLLSVEGLAQALAIYRGTRKHPNISYSFEKPRETMKVTGNVKGVRPYVVCAILRDIDLGEHGYKSLIDFQDKMH